MAGMKYRDRMGTRRRRININVEEVNEMLGGVSKTGRRNLTREAP